MRIVVESDGGSRGNPGTAGSGTVLYLKDGKTVAKVIAEYLGVETNNVAEYHGLKNGLEAAVALGATEVNARLDSKLIVEQMTGAWKIKHPTMQKLAKQCRDLGKKIGTVHYTWIPRAQNKVADSLANAAMDAGEKQGTKPGYVIFVDDTDPKTATKDVTDEPLLKHLGIGQSAPAPAEVGLFDLEEPQSQKVVTWTGETEPPTRLLLLRHGETPMSVAKQYSGSTDAELTAVGREEAAKAAGWFVARKGSSHWAGHIDAVVCSPLKRAVATAEPVAAALGLPITIDSSFVEMDFGCWEGLNFSQAREKDSALHASWMKDPSVAPPHGESVEVVFDRVVPAVKKLCSAYAGKTVLVVSHAIPIKAVLRMALNGDAMTDHRIHLALASLSVVEFFPGGSTAVRLVGGTAHLGE